MVAVNYNICMCYLETKIRGFRTDSLRRKISVIYTLYLAKKYGHQPFFLPYCLKSSRLYIPAGRGSSLPNESKF